VAYLVTDPLARIREANRAAVALLGVEQRFLAGKPLAAYVAGSDRWGFRTMVNRLHRDEDERVGERPLRLRRRGGEVVTVAATVEPVRRTDGQLLALRWLLRRLEPEETPQPALPVEVAVAQDGARRDSLEALEDLDPASDLDGSVQVLVDAGLFLLGVDGAGLMLADTQAGCAPPAGPTRPPWRSCGPRSTP
jgi:PAS domain S-box-containing protein